MKGRQTPLCGHIATSSCQARLAAHESMCQASLPLLRLCYCIPLSFATLIFWKLSQTSIALEHESAPTNHPVELHQNKPAPSLRYSISSQKSPNLPSLRRMIGLPRRICHLGIVHSALGDRDYNRSPIFLALWRD
ncbi:hypothetical protein B0H12DRAFT_347852 [Mycena haematopus]|nr:hypothetical protein B0H12DRAFT_347852 [Mycena haematopus]